MAKLIYSGIMSLDGYIADRGGKFDWSTPNNEVHAALNDLQRQNARVRNGVVFLRYHRRT
jgi:hypothetical protein